MLEWWNSLTILQQVLAYIAVPATLLLLIQTVLILIGIGHDGAGISSSDTSGLDLNSDLGGGVDGADSFDMGDLDDMGNLAHHNHGIDDGSSVGDFSTMRLFTLQGVVAFLAVFGWSSIAMLSYKIHPAIAIIVGLVLGFGAMYLVAKIIQLSGKLTQSGTLNMNNLLGASGNVYVVIPAKGDGQGKVNISLSERYLEFFAVSDCEASLKTGTEIRVVDIRGDVLVVEPME